MKLREIITTVWERKLVVALVLVFCLIGAGLYAFSKPTKQYASSSTIAFLPNGEDHAVEPPESVASLLTTYAVVAESQKTAAAAEKILGHPLTGSVVATPASDSWVLEISSEASSSEAAAGTAQAVTKALTETIRGGGVVKPTVINQPVASGVPVESRSPALIIAVAAVVGLIGGVLLALLVENLAGLPDGQAQGTAETPGQSA
jgi:capsular polysaccharide biosynthesis protein